MSIFTRKAFPPLPFGSTNRSGSVNLSRKNRFNNNTLRNEINNSLNATLPKARTLRFSNMVTANNGSTRKLRNNKNTRGQIHAFTQVKKPSMFTSMFNFNFLNPFAKQKKAEAAAYQYDLVESRKSVPKNNSYMKFFTVENRKEKRKWATNEQAQAERKRVNFGPREAKIMANLVAKYNSEDELLYALEGLNLSDDIKSKFRLNIYQLYNNLKANVKNNNENAFSPGT
jgi:hypothetical protein